tara:strand:+ start:323 stop:883 length:561 start_codon:yes stop_codon:yes gene_type:complete
MSYKLWTDKQEVFECSISLEGASLDDASSRIIVETENLNLMFEGTIDKNGNCRVPIRKLHGLLKEEVSGNMKLEVIAEDTYFQPWESDFTVDASKKIKVEVKEQSKPLVKSSKPKMVVSEVNHPFNPIDVMVNMLTEQGLSVKDVYSSKKKLFPILTEYSNKSGYTKGAKNFIKEVILNLSKKSRS